MKKYTGVYRFTLIVEAKDDEEASKKLQNLLEEIAGSNDGSELLADLTPITIEEE